jgi:chromosome partitioning protein
VRTIAIANQKGGCGKTTVAINLSASIAREGRRCLLVDLDPQAHCALGTAVPEEQIDLSIADCLLKQMEGEPIELSRITWQIAPNLDLAPSRAGLAGLETRLAAREDGGTVLGSLLAANAGRYDYCLIDCAPHMGSLMLNALRAANEVIIPVDTGYFSLHGLTQQLITIEQLGECNGKKPVVRVLPNQYDVRTKLAREILAELRKRFEGVVFNTIINFNTKLKEGASYGQPITEFAPTSMGARDFQNLARESMASGPQKVPTAEILEHVERLAADAERLVATTTTLVDNRKMMAAGKPLVDGKTAARSTATRDRSNDRKGAEAVQDEVPPSAVPPPSPADRLLEVSPGPLVPDEVTDRKIEAIYGVRQEGEVVVFRSHNSGASEVQLAGDFNDWMPHTTPMRRQSNGDYEMRLRLPKGRYRYRLVIDGRWSHDMHNPQVETNEYGELNSIVEVAR